VADVCLFAEKGGAYTEEEKIEMKDYMPSCRQRFNCPQEVLSLDLEI
jgi:hypothetical protein